MSKRSSLSKLKPNATIAQIVSADDEAGELLSSIGLNIDKHQDQSLQSVCKDRKWSEDEVLNWIKSKSQPQNGKAHSDFGNNLSAWTGYLQDKYHTANIARLDEINRGFPKVRQIHGNQYTWLNKMQRQFDRLEETIKMYYKFEEKKFFPLLKKLEAATDDLPYGTSRTLERGKNIIRKDQNRIREFMKKLRLNSNGFENPPNASSTLRILNQNFKMLFAAIDKQFDIETKKVLPLLQNQMEAVY